MNHLNLLFCLNLNALCSNSDEHSAIKEIHIFLFFNYSSNYRKIYKYTPKSKRYLSGLYAGASIESQNPLYT